MLKLDTFTKLKARIPDKVIEHSTESRPTKIQHFCERNGSIKCLLGFEKQAAWLKYPLHLQMP